MKTIYLTNGELNDPAFTGVTVTHYYVKDDGEIVGQNATIDGKPYFGYLPKEVSKEEYDLWVQRIANPDNVNYFAGIFAGVGVIDKATRQVLDAQIDAAKAAAEVQRKANISVKRVQALIALSRAGTTKPDIYNVIGALPSVQQEEALLWFEDSQHFVRNHPYINTIGAALGYSQTDLDDLFAVAETIK